MPQHAIDKKIFQGTAHAWLLKLLLGAGTAGSSYGDCNLALEARAPPSPSNALGMVSEEGKMLSDLNSQIENQLRLVILLYCVHCVACLEPDFFSAVFLFPINAMVVFTD